MILGNNLINYQFQSLQSRHSGGMIFSRSVSKSASKSSCPSTAKTQHNIHRSWKKKFRMSIYNQNLMKVCKDSEEKDTTESEQYSQAIYELVKRVRASPEKYESSKQQTKITSLFCAYIPLRKSVETDDQMINTFVFLRRKKQIGDLLEQNIIKSQIQQFLKKCKDTNKVQQGWGVCLRKFIIELDIIKKVQIYNQILKNGSQSIEEYHKIYAKKSILDVFAHAVMSASKYFQRQNKVNRAWKISVEVNDKITQANISKTMKLLYCPVCRIYQCGKHKLEDKLDKKNYHYAHPKKIIKKGTHICKSIMLLKQLKQSSVNNRNTLKKFCSPQCFRRFNSQKFEQLQLQKCRIMSPMVESIIKLGIQMFSYDPCSIMSLFPQNDSTRLTCAIICMFLIEEANLEERLTNKTNYSQVQLLKNECSDKSILEITAIQELNDAKKKRKNKKKDKKQEDVDESLAVCFHLFIGQQEFDHTCEKCCCQKRGYCLPECMCGPACTLAVIGCSCENKQVCRTKSCSCWKQKIECIPGVCKNCFCLKGQGVQKNMCKNNQIQKGHREHIKIGLSKVTGAGFGGFAANRIKNGSLISTYTGEQLEDMMQNIRQTIKKDDSLYSFENSSGSLDARFMGNKSRFINHSDISQFRTNCQCFPMTSMGQSFIAIYAIKDIEEGEQLYFDYDITGEIAQLHGNLYPFLKLKK